MPSALIRLYKIVHTWAGIVAGLALFIAFYAGSLTLFEEALETWLTPPSVTHAVPLGEADALIADTLRAHPEAAQEFTLHLTPEGMVSHLSWKQGKTDRRPWVAERDADGRLHAVRRQPSTLPQFIDTLHRTAGIPGNHEIGETVMGIISVIYAVALISGLVILLPSLVKDFFALRIGRNLKRMWLDAHNLIGITGLPFHLVIAMTSVVFCLHDPLYALQEPLIYNGKFREMTLRSNLLAGLPKEKTPNAMLPPQALVNITLDLSPELHVHTIQYRAANTTGASARLVGDDPRHLVRKAGFVMLAATTGEVLSTEYLPGHQSNWSTIVSALFALHIGTFGGTTLLWIYFGLGLAGAFLFYSGNLLWIETRRRKASRKGEAPSPVQRRNAKLMAAGTVGICLGCICGISLTIVASKWLHGHVGDLTAWLQLTYYTVFFGGIAWAFARGNAKAAVDLLSLASFLTLSIPLTTLLAWVFPGLGLWANGGVAALGVDATAFGGGLCFAWMARATARRVRLGPTDSVWSAHKTPVTVKPGMAAVRR
jgi:uncharacterized iron-regulated membrane protein